MDHEIYARNMQQTLKRASTARDKISNGRILPKSVDLRSTAGRRFKHLVRTYEAELGGEPTELQRGLVRQVATIQIQIERTQADIVGGSRVVDSDEVIRLSSEHRRLLNSYYFCAALSLIQMSRTTAPPSLVKAWHSTLAFGSSRSANSDLSLRASRWHLRAAASKAFRSTFVTAFPALAAKANHAFGGKPLACHDNDTPVS
ncbi:hypothetical protein AC629_41260 [Bradyrhizobium sp. NAS80.1]|nr:hypothetical protein AC629_41260 [Bradyrhizobium sp. NAS80.1]